MMFLIFFLGMVSGWMVAMVFWVLGRWSTKTKSEISSEIKETKKEVKKALGVTDRVQFFSPSRRDDLESLTEKL